MKRYLSIFALALQFPSIVLAGGILGAASDIVHGAADIATDTTDAALSTVDTALPRRSVVTDPLDYEEEYYETDISPDVEATAAELEAEEPEGEYQHPFIDRE